MANEANIAGREEEERKGLRKKKRDGRDRVQGLYLYVASNGLAQ